MTPSSASSSAQKPVNPKVLAWIETKRGIPAEVAIRGGLTSHKGNPAFEYRRASGLQYVKARLSQPDGGKSFQRDRQNAETCMFGEELIEAEPELSHPLVIFEGEIDKLTGFFAGIPNSTSVPDGAQLAKPGEGKIIPEEDKPFSWLWEDGKLKKHIAQFDKIVLATDDDQKGRILREELAVRLDRWKCYFVEYPEGCKDANDVLIKYGREAVVALIDNAKPVVPASLISIADYHDRDTGEILETGFKGFDTSTEDGGSGFSFMVPELCIITGMPGSGKSEFAVVMAAHLANVHNMPGAIFQFEDNATRVYKTLERYAMNSVQGIGDDKQAAREWIRPRFKTIAPPEDLDHPDFTLDWIKDAIREARTRHGCRWVIIDPWNEIEHLWDSRGVTESTYINNALRSMKRLARAYQIILFIVAHPNVSGGRNQSVDDADLYSISGGAALNNKADHGFIVVRPDKSSNEVHIKLAKSKDHSRMGKPATFTYIYQWSSATYRYVGKYQSDSKNA